MNDTHCTITLPASQFTTNHGSSLASMSFSSDGSTLAWGQDDGVYEANVSNPNDCASVQRSVRLVVPGAQMPFLGAAPLSAARTQVGKPVASFALRPRHARARHAVHFNGSLSHERGSRIVRYRWTFGDGTRSASAKASAVHVFRRPGQYIVTLTVVDAAGRTGTIKRRVTVYR